MTDRKKVLTLTAINFAFFAFFILLHYNGVFSIKILNANPFIPLALLVTVCMFASHLTSAMTGLYVGIFLDSSAATPQGFHAILFLLLGLAVSLTAHYLFNNNIFSAVALCAIASGIYFILRWIFCYSFALEFTQSLNYIMRYALPSVLYTTVFSVPLYYLERYLYSKYYYIH